jgi:hypothetical protein
MRMLLWAIAADEITPRRTGERSSARALMRTVDRPGNA